MIWTGSAGPKDLQLVRTSSTGTPTGKALADVVVGSPVVLAGGDVVVGDASNRLHRYTSALDPVWDSDLLEGTPLSPVVLTGGEALLVVPTRNGRVVAIDPAGKVLWSGLLGGGQELHEANLYTPAGSAYSYALIGSVNGKLYAVMVEGRLDTAAPWPKAFHDVRNTGNASSPLR